METPQLPPAAITTVETATQPPQIQYPKLPAETADALTAEILIWNQRTAEYEPTRTGLDTCGGCNIVDERFAQSIGLKRLENAELPAISWGSPRFVYGAYRIKLKLKDLKGQEVETALIFYGIGFDSPHPLNIGPTGLKELGITIDTTEESWSFKPVSVEILKPKKFAKLMRKPAQRATVHVMLCRKVLGVKSINTASSYSLSARLQRQKDKIL